MHRQAEALACEAHQLVHARRGVAGASIGEEGEHVGDELVGLSRSGLVRQQPRKAARFEGPDGLVTSRARQAEAGGAAGDRQALHAHRAQHLVLDLQQVPGVEERLLDEARVADPFGMPVETSVLS